MKPKIVDESEKFWKRVFEYFKTGGYEAYSYFYYVVLTPSVRFNESRSFQKFFDKFSNLAGAPVEEQLARHNVFVRFYSPVKVTEDVPSLPIVFNVEVASHSVWNHVKHKKPLIVSGWNDKILTWRIVEWLAKGRSEE
ncbi:MAG: hypothetical protein QXS54_04215 [Candidatus Methanomethylicaceae archaeon]